MIIPLFCVLHYVCMECNRIIIYYHCIKNVVCFSILPLYTSPNLITHVPILPPLILLIKSLLFALPREIWVSLLGLLERGGISGSHENPA